MTSPDEISQLNGAVMLVCGGRTVLCAANGTADTTTDAPCTPQSRFRIASVSKQFTAAAIMLLVKAEELSLHESITRWLPDTTRTLA